MIANTLFCFYLAQQEVLQTTAGDGGNHLGGGRG